MSIADQLLTVNNIKTDIRNAIIAKGVPVSGSTSFSGYTEKILEIGDYVRPTEWLTLPTVITGDTKFVGLYAVYDSDTNYVGMECGQNYTVNWGDGVIENFVSGATARHNFVYSGSTFTGQTVTSFGYKQSIITVTPQSGYQFTKVDINILGNALFLTGASSGWLDIKMAGSGMTNLRIGETTLLKVRHSMLERFEFVGSHIFTNIDRFFGYCTSLQEMIMDTSNLVWMGSMFAYCNSLRKGPIMDTSNVTQFGSMFINNYSLESVPNYDLSKNTGNLNMFQLCWSLKNTPPLNFVNNGSLFNSASSLTTFNPKPGISLSGNIVQMFRLCYALKTVPLINVSGVTNFGTTGITTTFFQCFSLISCGFSGGTKSIAYNDCNLNTKALIEIFINLGISSGQVIDISGNPGVSGLTTGNKAIATGKGWIIIGG